MKTIYITPTLSKQSKNRVLYWYGEVYEEDNNVYTRSVFWQLLEDGTLSKLRYSDSVKIEGKNIGKANETSLKDQGISEITSAFNKQKDSGYLEEGESPSELVLPMLAHDHSKHGHKLTYPVYVQPKYDGMRMLSNGVAMWSRQGKEAIKECIEHLLIDTGGYTLDGELILPQPYSFQDTIKACKKFRPDVSPKLLWRVYDLVDTNLPFSKRFELLESIVSKLPNPHNIILTPTKMCETEEEVSQFFQEFTQSGEEGLMLRSPSGVYEINRRSYSLQKMKEFLDEEFTVVDVSTNPKRPDEAQLVCDVGDGRTFKATVKASREERAKLLLYRAQTIGQVWTIKFQNKTDDGIPRFPIALRQREDI